MRGVLGYSLVDSLDTDVWLALDEGYVAAVDTSVGSITGSPPAWSLTDNAQRAVDRAPDWLKGELADAFRHLGATDQDRFASPILNMPDHYVDEIAFTVAHLPTPNLTDPSFEIQVITDNAVQLYQIDRDRTFALLHERLAAWAKKARGTEE